MPRCNDCNKFVGLDQAEPEVQDETLSADPDGLTFEVSVRIVNNCADCGTELRESTLDVSDQFDAEFDEDVEEYRLEIEDLSDTCDSEGKGRGTKTFYGFVAQAVLYADDEEIERKEIAERTQASYMDEC